MRRLCFCAAYMAKPPCKQFTYAHIQPPVTPSTHYFPVFPISSSGKIQRQSVGSDRAVFHRKSTHVCQADSSSVSVKNPARWFYQFEITQTNLPGSHTYLSLPGQLPSFVKQLTIHCVFASTHLGIQEKTVRQFILINPAHFSSSRYSINSPFSTHNNPSAIGSPKDKTGI